MSKKNLMNHLLLYIKSKQEIGSKHLIKRKKKKSPADLQSHPRAAPSSAWPSLAAICKVGYWRDIGSVGVGRQLAGDVPERGGWVNGGGQGQLR